jgi:four helix bundle protein
VVIAGERTRKTDDFELYRVAREFRKRGYVLLRQLPWEEKYALADQMRRAAVSGTNNIAEGHGRWHYQENIRLCRISRGSFRATQMRSQDRSRQIDHTSLPIAS